MTGRWLNAPLPHRCELPNQQGSREGQVWLCDCGRGFRLDCDGWRSVPRRRLRRLLAAEQPFKGAVIRHGTVPSGPPPPKPRPAPGPFEPDAER